VEDHPEGAELAWLARGYPFTRPVVARSNVGVRRKPAWVAMEPQYEQFVRVELMADSFHGQDASAFGWFRDLEWLGPLVLPNDPSSAARAPGPLRTTDGPARVRCNE
jgi:hypothetical protein